MDNAERKVWIVMRNADTVEGRGPMVDVGLAFTNKEQADKYIDWKPGVMGRRLEWSKIDHGDWTLKELTLLDTAPEGFERDKEAVIAQALKKLTAEEKQVLGLPHLEVRVEDRRDDYMRGVRKKA